jgi:hypothetical protein
VSRPIDLLWLMDDAGALARHFETTVPGFHSDPLRELEDAAWLDFSRACYALESEL